MLLLLKKIGVVCLLFMLSLECVDAQQNYRLLTGSIKDSNGEILIGANIIVYDSLQNIHGTTTDISGNFKLKCPSYITRFHVKMVGYEDVTVKISPKKNSYQIYMHEALISMEEVVVTGYVNKSKKSYTGSLHTIKRDDIQKMVHTNLLDIIQLQTPGFEIMDDITNGSNPNKIPDMILRGRSSFVEGDNTNVPLFILDGTEVDISYVFDMDPNDIESITILKDASATAFYGSKAANGVVVISTLPTKAGKLKVNYTGNLDMSIPDLSDYHLLNAEDKLKYELYAGVYGNMSGESQEDINRQKVYYEKLERVNAGVNSNWKDLALRNGMNHSHNLSFSGGKEDFKYNFSGSYNHINGIMEKSDRENTSLRIKLSYGDFNRLFFQNTTSVSFTKSEDVPYGSFADYVRLNPYDPIYNEDGTPNNQLSFNAANPLYEQTLGNYIHKKQNSFINTFNIRWNIYQSLRMEASLSYSMTTGDNNIFYSPDSKRFVREELTKRGSFDVAHSTGKSWSGNMFLVYNKTWNEKTLLGFTAGINIESTSSDSYSFRAIGILSDKLDHVSMSTQYAPGSKPGGSKENARMLGYFLNANYIWDDRYFIDLSFRYEGSTKFGSDNKYAPFGSLGIGWNIHKESFIAGDWLSLLKFRASIGLVGNTNFSPYQSHLAYRYNSDLYYNGAIGAIPVSMVNPHLKWERSVKKNLGIDFGIFRHRISGSLDFYHDVTNHLVMSISKPTHIGFPEAKENLGKIVNKGVDLSIRANVLKRQHSNLNVYLNLGHNSNRIVSISDYLKTQNEKNEAAATGALPAAFYEEGESMTALKVMKSAGINPANGKEIFIRRDGSWSYEYDYRDKYTAGDTSPKVSGSFGSSFSWKSFDLAATFSYRLGATVYNQTLATKVEGASPVYNVDSRVFYDRWKEPGDAAKYKNIASREIPVPTDRFVAKEFAMNCSSVKLSYSLPAAFCQKMYVERMRLSLSTGELFNLSSVKRERGLEYPFARTFQFSLTINL